MNDELRGPDDERPPVFGSWRNFYGVVIGVLAFEIVVFTLLTRWFS